MTRIILASASPRRKELLEQIGISFSVFPVDIDEMPLIAEQACDYVERMAREKAEYAYQQTSLSEQIKNGEQSIILAADTSVVVDNEIFGKPVDRTDFERMMRRLSGRQHEVITGIHVIDGRMKTVDLAVASSGLIVTTKVNFKSLTSAEIEAYWQSGEPVDKAGGYGIQGMGAVFIEGIDGSYSNVVGLPLKETTELLAQYKVDIWSSGEVVNREDRDVL